ncbi:hypothetical protein ACLMJK_006830 [Lecanora helva]
MASKNADVWLWVGLAVLGYYASMIVHKQLIGIREAAKVTHVDKSLETREQRKVDALKLQTLGELAQNHTNVHIRDASLNILIERLLYDHAAWNQLLRDISGTEIESRSNALKCLRFLTFLPRNNTLKLLLCTSDTFNAVVQCLVNLLPEARCAERGDANESTYRSQVEQDCLKILELFLLQNHKQIQATGIVGRWLVKYPFGGSDASLLQKTVVIVHIIEGFTEYKDTHFRSAMPNILRNIYNHACFENDLVTNDMLWPRSELGSANFTKDEVAAGLPSQQEEAWHRVPTGAVRFGGMWSTGSEEIYDPPSSMDFFRHVPKGAIRVDGGYHVLMGNYRGREGSFEERTLNRRLRRRRRGAVVIGRDDGQPINDDDIIQRDMPSLDEETEREIRASMRQYEARFR